MSNNGGPTVAVKLYIDKEKRKVLFAESDKEFVDVLFSFLTLPLGTVVRLLGTQPQIGCLDVLYRSVEGLSKDHFRTKACKAMLLRPLNAAADFCDRLKVKVDTNPRDIFVCPSRNCYDGDGVFSYFPGSCQFCNSARILRQMPLCNQTAAGVFVMDDMKFIVFDDLHVAPASTSTMFPLLDKFGLHKQGNIEEKVLELNSHKMTSLFKRALVSKQCLTGLHFDDAIATDSLNLDQLPSSSFFTQFPKEENKADCKFNAVKITLVQTKDHTSVLYAEVVYDFVDLVIGLLSIPLGSVVKAYGQVTWNGSDVDNLYKTINGSGRGCIKQECISLLLSPMVAPFFPCSSSVLLQVQESPRKSWYNADCIKCFRAGPSSSCHHRNGINVTEENPKSPSGSTAASVPFLMVGLGIFVVTDDLKLIPFSLASTLQVIRSAKIPNEMLVKKELTLDKSQVLKLLRAALVTVGYSPVCFCLLRTRESLQHIYL